MMELIVSEDAVTFLAFPYLKGHLADGKQHRHQQNDKRDIREGQDLPYQTPCPLNPQPESQQIHNDNLKETER